MSGAVDESGMARLHFDPLRLNEIIFPPPGPNPLAESLTRSARADDRARPRAEDLRRRPEIRAEVRAALTAQSAGLSPQADFLLAGQPAFTADISRHMKRDIIIMLAFTIALTSLAFWLTYRSLMPLLWIVVAQMLAVLCAAVAARLVFTQINVHQHRLLVDPHRRGHGLLHPRLSLLRAAGELDLHEWRELRRAIWLSSVTTAATFGILFFSSFPGLRQLAVLVGVGLIATWLFRHHLSRPPAGPAPAERAALAPARQRPLARVSSAATGSPFASRPERSCVTVLVASRGPLSHFGYLRSERRAARALGTRTLPGAESCSRPGPQDSGRGLSPAGIRAESHAWQPVIDLAALSAEFTQAGFDSDLVRRSTAQIVDVLNRWHAGAIDLTGSGPRERAAWVQLQRGPQPHRREDFERLSLYMLVIVLTLCFVAHIVPRSSSR